MVQSAARIVKHSALSTPKRSCQFLGEWLSGNSRPHNRESVSPAMAGLHQFNSPDGVIRTFPGASCIIRSAPVSDTGGPEAKPDEAANFGGRTPARQDREREERQPPRGRKYR
jgi:hypothetical protein